MLVYRIKSDSGVTWEWEVEESEEQAKKAHRQLRRIIRTELDNNKEKGFEVTINGSNKELVERYQQKAENYISKQKGQKVTKTKKATYDKTDLEMLLDEGVYEKIITAFKEGNLTVMEARVMNWLLKEGFYAEYGLSDVVVQDIANGLDINVKSVKGVVGSLTKKDYLYTMEMDGLDVVYATDEGYQLADDYEERWG